MFVLRRRTARDGSDAEDGLELLAAHETVVAPRHGVIAWDAWDRTAYPSAFLSAAADAWRERARQEYASLALFTQLASQVHLLGAPLDWAGAFVRMTGDEVRHTELCARFAELLAGDGAGHAEGAATIDEQRLHLPLHGASLRAHVRETIVAAFCIGETLSGRMFRRCLRAATVPLAKDIVRTIADDETFHGRFGWEAAALLMRGDDARLASERAALVASLPQLFAHYRGICGADLGQAWARDGDEAEPAPNFGTLSRRGYARAFYDGMAEDVVPGLVAIGFPEAEDAWRGAAVP